jgi:alpha-glucosidase (family GH31 glycosyl hydrolase)
MLNNHLIIKADPIANKSQFGVYDKTRVTVLGDGLIRIEHGAFCDEPTQTVFFRNFPDLEFEKTLSGDTLTIKTKSCVFDVSVKHGQLLSAFYNGKQCTQTKNLKGTRRTLDGTFGKVKLSDGLLTKGGLYIHNDTKSLILVNGEVKLRSGETNDQYVFCYGDNFNLCLSNFYAITGAPPLLPRYAFGNWWSRYYPYSQKSYIELMNKFKTEDTPLSVAVIDMDWHWVNVNEKFGANFEKGNFGQHDGWTGYSFNTDLFPDVDKFFEDLRALNLKATLNLHPRDGVRFFEDKYNEMALALGIDPATKQTVNFNIADTKFINAYFDILHHPLEKQGVDFWWMDWQQGKTSALAGLDPLWSLNHYHYLDNMRDGKRGMLFSRYAGFGSHRYGIGFSGDTAINWKVLNFQPHFTNAANNAGYPTWSHDIGGHMLGFRDDELYLRWLQLGVFSSINRLHSTKNELMSREPWGYSKQTEIFSKELMRLRHKLIPYIYSEYFNTHKNGTPLCRPLYYVYPNDKRAYDNKNQYHFGSQLLVAPITQKICKKTLLAKTRVWLPEDVRYTDIFSGRIYQGGKELNVFRKLNELAVFAREGSIIPTNASTDIGNPINLNIDIYRGNGAYTLFEDDGESVKTDGAFTAFEVKEEGDKITLIIKKPTGNLNVIPKNRRYLLNFKDVLDGRWEMGDGSQIYKQKPIEIPFEKDKDIVITLTDAVALQNPPIEDDIIDLFSRTQARNLTKMAVYKKFRGVSNNAELKKLAKGLRVLRCLKEPIEELLN